MSYCSAATAMAAIQTDRVEAILKLKGDALWSIPKDASVYEAIELMAAKGIGALPVLENGRVIGMLSERDYARRVVLEGRSSRQTLVSEIMSRPVITIAHDATIDECMRMMTNERIRHIPVTRGGCIAGMISIGDVVNWIISTQNHTIEQLQSYIYGSYPG